MSMEQSINNIIIQELCQLLRKSCESHAKILLMDNETRALAYITIQKIHNRIIAKFLNSMELKI